MGGHKICEINSTFHCLGLSQKPLNDTNQIDKTMITSNRKIVENG